MLKKSLLTGFVSLSLVASLHAEEKSGFFAGIHGGASFVQSKVEMDSKAVSDDINISFNGGVNVGYQYFFVPYVGLRAYASYDFNGFSKDISLHDLTGNVDLLLNVFNGNSVSFGLFAGLGFGYSILAGVKDNGADFSGFITPINVGLSLTIAERHRIELGGKLPLIFYPEAKKMEGTTTVVRPWVANVGYTFIF